jgi:hypothetical protein
MGERQSWILVREGIRLLCGQDEPARQPKRGKNQTAQGAKTHRKYLRISLTQQSEAEVFQNSTPALH